MDHCGPGILLYTKMKVEPMIPRTHSKWQIEKIFSITLLCDYIVMLCGKIWNERAQKPDCTENIREISGRNLKKYIAS